MPGQKSVSRHIPSKAGQFLSTENHDRDVAGLRYVYPVVSRRAGGVSLGINLNPNHRCNWQCVYCQVPNLKRGVADAVDLPLLEKELDNFLQDILYGDYMEQHVPEGCRKLQDLAISGNGEPTTCPDFAHVVTLALTLMQKYALGIPLRLITNGSAVHKPHVRQGLRAMADHGGEVWFKVDAVGRRATWAVNGVRLSERWQREQLQITADTCPTWIQTCVVRQNATHEPDMASYVRWLNDGLNQGIRVEGILLYSLARPSMQQGGDKLAAVDKPWLNRLAQKIESLGLVVKVS